MDKLRQKMVELFSQKYVPGHDIKHILRVAALARYIAAHEGYDEEEAELAGLLHDVGRLTSNTESHAEENEELVVKLLNEYIKLDQKTKNRILDAIKQHSNKESSGDLAHILQDADKLDGLGAIGIVRAYISKSHLVDFPEEVIAEKGSRDAKNISEQIAFMMEWYDMLYTTTAKEIAKKRFKFMKEFMKELKREVEEFGK